MTVLRVPKSTPTTVDEKVSKCGKAEKSCLLTYHSFSRLYRTSRAVKALNERLSYRWSKFAVKIGERKKDGRVYWCCGVGTVFLVFWDGLDSPKKPSPNP